MARLTGKTFLITGASGYMGGDFARAFAREGADLVLTSRTLAKLENLAEELRRDFGRRVACVAADISRADQIAQLAESAWSAFDGLDGVLLSAQPENTFLGDILTTPDEQWEAQHNLLVWGPLRLMRALAPKMMERGKGSIVSVISSTGLNPTPGCDAYGMAKGSLWLLTKYMAKEWGHKGIRANAINPGTIVPATGAEKMRELAEKTGTLNRMALGRLGYNSEVVGAAVYFASDESSFCSGQLINIDGGRF
jgi:NAD(P)-dependent dehydrogenase (short-subunit alcohol dehydrogenase family)